MSGKPFDIRTPSVLLYAPLKPLTKLVWLAIRSYQGQGKWCTASLETIGKRVVNQTGNPTNKSRISSAVKELENKGWIKNGGRLKLCCLVPEFVAERATSTSRSLLPKEQQVVAERATNPDGESCRKSNSLLLKEQQFVAERATRTENKTLKQDFKTRGVVVNTQSFNPEGNADPKTSNSAASDNLDFLSEKESVYEPSIREALETFPPDFIQQAFTHLLKGDHRKATPTASLLALRKKYGHVKLMAALVLAGCETKGGASLKYLEGFMKRWQAPAPSPAIAGGGPVQFPVYDDPESFLDDPEVIGR